MKNKFSSMALIATVTLSALVGSMPAQAGIGELASLIKSPLGRYVLLETETGASIASHFLGSGGQIGAEDLDRLISRMSTEEMSANAEQLEARLSKINDRFRYLAPKVSGDMTQQFVESLVAEEMGAKIGSAGEFEFLPSKTGHTFAVERENFIKSEEEGRMATADLSGHKFGLEAKLSGRDLRFANLSDLEAPVGHFEKASMQGADLSGANLPSASLKSADLSYANLRGTQLKGATLRGAKLVGADLTSANLSGADLSSADLRGANLTDAFVRQPYFRNGVGTQFKGAIYNSKTQLPFSAEEAKKLGMILVAG